MVITILTAILLTVAERAWTPVPTEELDSPLPIPGSKNGAVSRLRFTDALGEPLPGATVEIWITRRDGSRICLGRTALDSAGGLACKTSPDDLRFAEFVVSHADYGCAQVRQPFEPNAAIVAPLLRTGTVAADRAIWGRVVDPNGAPVAGAIIHCPYVRTLGEGLINATNETPQGITDANGAFSFYMPNRRNRDDRGELIPPKSRYCVRIEPPKALQLLPYVEPIENGRESLIVLERGDRLRQLRFEDPNGEITDPTRLRSITVSLRRPGRNVLTLCYDDWKDGVPLVPGAYEASMRESGEESRFEPVEITQDSPEEVIFRLPAPVTYYGRVVHGLTGQPMPAAFVLAMNANAEDRLCDLTTEQWDTLHSLADNPAQDDPALGPLRKIYGFTKLVRTDRTGSYGIALEADQSFYGFVAFEQDYLAVMQRRHALEADADRFAEVPTIKLFPAAMVLVETVIDKEHPSIMPKWEIDEQSRPAWVGELLAIDNNRESSLEYDDWLEPNARQAVSVPAGVRLRLRLETPYDDEFCPVVIPQKIRLAEGQTANLGQFVFERAISVQVKAVDATGQALEGIPIRSVQTREGERPCWSVVHNTDEKGIARFYLIPNSSGSFGVLYHSDDGVHLTETLDYKVGGPEDAGRKFVLQLSDEILTYLLQ
ncbi:MAG TPA: carboxypeptidase-like regulatory domain-containing protein [Sedimentisphaerales bacterium]|jgi:hypothetical protein|nr:carboxypeptidase-like regulatory domain-containing protein [Sedimentisphaerales bacterium]HNU30078.1 carboxypeptidase-like regulatory domain-containing protein [Sedimentisphaerales bacterium]